MKAIRWSDNDQYFGPFTYCGSDYSRWAIMLGSGDNDDYPRCRLRVQLGTKTFITLLPQWVLKPKRFWVDTSKYGWSDNPKGGYWDTYEREYGFTYGEKSLHVHFGEQTMSWPGSKSKCYSIPWIDQRFVRMSYYGEDGKHFYTEPLGLKWSDKEYNESKKISESCPSIKFEFIDFDNQRIEVTTTIEEREWHRGTGKFKWLSLFYKPMVSRSLSLNFSSEVGPEKGSWKGGMLGHAINMLSGELHEEAFRRYCDEEQSARHGRKYRITYIGKI